MSIVYLNGEFLPVEEARVSVLDRGFTFADSVYEVIPVYAQTVFRVEEHLQRLDNSLSAIDISNPLENSKWKQVFADVLEKNPSSSDRSLYVQVTRGVSERDHLKTSNLHPTVFVMSRTASDRDYSAGVTAITHDDIRWDYCHIKTTALLANVLLKQKAQASGGAFETILIKDGRVTEAAASNVFVIKDNTVMTAKKDGSVLPGITRDLLVELLQYANIPCLEQSVSLEELRAASEVWISSSSVGVAPVIQIDGEPVADGKVGEMWRKANQLFLQFKANPNMLR